jgi:exosome complex component RRP42
MKHNKDAPNSSSHIIKALEANIRYDGRKKDEFRPIEIEYGVSNTADGSAKITCGETEIICAASLSVGTPFPDRPDEGALMVSAEYLPIAHNSIESGPPGIVAIEASRVIDRSIRESGSVDVKKLCIVEGEKVWVVSVDVIPLNHDGNIIDVGALGAIAAIKNAKFPGLTDKNKADYKNKTDKGLELVHIPISITVCRIGNELFIDPRKVEEDNVDARLTIAVMEDGRICSLQKGGDDAFTHDEVNQAIDMAVTASKGLRKYLE